VSFIGCESAGVYSKYDAYGFSYGAGLTFITGDTMGIGEAVIGGAGADTQPLLAGFSQTASNLRIVVRSLSGSSPGTLIRFYKNGGAGQQVVSTSSTGLSEDTSHTDTVAASDTMALFLTTHSDISVAGVSMDGGAYTPGNIGYIVEEKLGLYDVFTSSFSGGGAVVVSINWSY
jgi:hypothetical protein